MFATITKAETTSGSDSASVVPGGFDINDPAYLQSIGLVKGEVDHGIPVEVTGSTVAPRLMDVSRLRPLEEVVPESDGDIEMRGNCVDIYRNTGGFFSFIFSDDTIPPNSVCLDDITPAATTTERFICEVEWLLGWFGPLDPTFTVRCGIWGPYTAGAVCPESGSSLLAEAIILQASPTYTQKLFTFNEVLVPNTWGVSVASPAVGDANNGPACVIDNVNVCNAVELGTSADNFFLGDTPDDNNCANNTYFFGGCGAASPEANFIITVRATPGPSGSCCNQTTAVCTDGIFLGNCNAFGQAFSLDPCPQVPPCAICDRNCTGATVLENEPVCATNYVDTKNNGCAFDPPATESFINVTCGADICGEYGTYIFMNGTITEQRRDNDYYRITLASTQRVTFSVDGEGSSNATIFIPIGPGNGCDGIVQPNGTGDVGTATTTAGCSAAVATACLPPGTYYLVARPGAFTGIPCGTDYRATVTCVACTLPTGACCLPTGSCVLQTAIGCQQQLGLYHGDGVACPPTGPACPQPPTNETCTTKALVTGNKTIGFDTTFAVTESTANVVCGETNLPVFKDVWYDYKLNAADHPAGVTFGRLAISTYETCFDTKLVVYRVPDCSANQATQCGPTLQELQCNDDINAGRGNLASYLEVLDNGDGVLPSPGQCFKIRVGGATATDGGAGFMRVDFLPSQPAPWSATSGRCCFTNGTCQIRTDSGDPGDCTASGGQYITSTTNFGEGDVAVTEFGSVGCNTLPCPAAGEACFNALNLNSILGGSGFGTTTRAIKNRLYYRYQIPFAAPPGSGITISTCGSSFDTAIAVYSDFNQSSGECMGETPIASNDDCSASETSAAGAQGIASCFNNSEVDSCLCLTVGTIGQPTGPGSTIYIEIGASNTIAGSSQLSIDPVPQNCGTAVTASLTVTASAACFVCNIVCPGGAVLESEPVCAANSNDTTNVGCNATSPAPFVFKDITCGTTVCGDTGTFVFFNGTTSVNTRDTDWYRFAVTTAKKIDLSLNASFPAALFLVRDTNPGSPCTEEVIVASTTSDAGCITTNLSFDACAGTYYIVVTTRTFTGVDCGSDYTMTVNCNAPALANCCKGDMNNDGSVNGLDIRGFVDVVLRPITGPFPITGCYNLNTCRVDFNNDTLATTADIPGFVTDLLTKPDACSALATCSDPARCHLPDQSGGATSDLNTALGCNARVADDFKVDSAGNIQSICWYGFYLNVGAGLSCTPQSGSSADNFRVTIYNDNAGVPGTVRSTTVVGAGATKTDTGVDINLGGTIGNVREFKYETSITSTSVNVNTCYWIEIVNTSTGNCCWAWSLGGFANDVSASRNGGPGGTPNYVAADLGTGDMAFCLNNIRINKRDCGLPQGRCCQTGQICSVTDIFTCVNVLDGAWLEGGNCTSGCPAPGADNCANAAALQFNLAAQGSTVGLTNDGPLSACETGCAAACDTAPDVWYTLTTTAGQAGATTITLCGATDFDTILTVYTGTCGALTAVAGGCDDDSCGGVGVPSVVHFTATASTTYRVKIMGWGGDSGNYTVLATQP